MGKIMFFIVLEKRRNLHVHFEIIASLGDQPERRSMNYMLLGNSTHFSRYQYSANVGAVSLYLPPCENYVAGIKEDKHYVQKDIKCIHCVNWNLIM